MPQGETAVIRAHGVTPQVQRDLEARAERVIDATCPFVTKVQKLAERAAEQGRDVVLVGNPDHPEMIGVVGYAPERTRVVRDASEVASLPPLHAPLVVSQTTLKLSTFLEAAEAVRAKSDSEPQVVNTICSATRDRQDAARALAGEVDAFYVIGGKHSSNSLKLLSVCKEQCAQSFLIETPEEIDPADLAGAATRRRHRRRLDAQLAHRTGRRTPARDRRKLRQTSKIKRGMRNTLLLSAPF